MTYRFSIILGIVLALAACSKRAEVRTAPLATLDDCHRVYQQILNNVMIDEIDPDLHMSFADFALAESELDQNFQADGTKDKFFLVCQMRMTHQQAECAMHTQHAVDINNCTKFIPHK